MNSTFRHPLERFRFQAEQIGVGLMSGTSMDGIDAAVVRFRKLTGERGGGEPEGLPSLRVRDASVEVLGFRSQNYSEALHHHLRALVADGSGKAHDFGSLDTAVSMAFAEATKTTVLSLGLSLEEVDFLAAHGQTVAHAPGSRTAGGAHDSARSPIELPCTMQLGRPTMIAALSGIMTVGDFRSGDLALGGEAAPLVPYADYLLHTDEHKDRALINIGGIANLTFLRAGGSPAEVVAFDTGPGNMVLDGLVRSLSGGSRTYDVDGEWSCRGTAREEMLDELLAHPFFSRRPPKSTGSEDFGETFGRRFSAMAERLGLSREDAAATAAELTVRSIAGAIERFLDVDTSEFEVFLSGGGARNPYFSKGLERRGMRCKTTEALGLDPDQKEAVDFAVLGRETLLGRTGNLKRVTGAAQELPLGAVALPSLAKERSRA